MSKVESPKARELKQRIARQRTDIQEYLSKCIDRNLYQSEAIALLEMANTMAASTYLLGKEQAKSKSTTVEEALRS